VIKPRDLEERTSQEPGLIPPKRGKKDQKSITYTCRAKDYMKKSWGDTRKHFRGLGIGDHTGKEIKESSCSEGREYHMQSCQAPLHTGKEQRRS